MANLYCRNSINGNQIVTNFEQAMIALLLCHEQNFVATTVLQFGSKENVIITEFEFWYKKVK